MSTYRSLLLQHVRSLRSETLRLVSQVGDPGPLMSLDLSFAQFRCILAMYGKPPQTMSAIADRLGISLPTATGMMDRLVAAGLAARSAHSTDRRLVLCSLTEAAEAAVRQHYQAWSVENDSVIEVLSDAELQTVADSLGILNRAAARLREKANTAAVSAA